MTDIRGIGRAGGVDPSGSAGLDSDTLLSYCAAQLDGLNGDIEARMDSQRRVADAKANLTMLKQSINPDKDHKYSPEEQKQISAEYQAALQETPPGKDRDALVAALKPYFDSDCNAKVFPDPGAAQSALDQVGDGLAKNAELEMISLQDLVSKRQMAVQMTTQIMAKFAQGLETIGNNIK